MLISNLLKYNFLFLVPLTQSKTITSIITQTIPAPSSPTKISSSYSSDSDFRSTILNSTNFYRNQHNATVLKWNETLATYAAAYVRQCKWKHSAGPFGENLAEAYPNVTSAIEAWGNERRKYDFGRPTGFSEATGHFTQLVWKATKSVGCARFDCDGGGGGGGGVGAGGEGKGGKGAKGGKGGGVSAYGWMIVCEYWPPGNVETQYKAQVQKQTQGKGGKHGNGAGMNKAGGGGGGGVVGMFAMMAMVVFVEGMFMRDW